MSRSQGAANGGGQQQRHPAGEADPRTGGRPAQQHPQAPQYAPPPQAQQSAPYPPQGYAEPQQGQPPAYHYPQPPPTNRQGLSSLDSARNAQPTQDFDNYPRTQPPAYAQQRPQAPQRAQVAPPADRDPIHAAGGYRQIPPPAAHQGAPQYASRPAQRDAATNFGAAPSYDQWPAPAQPTYGQDLGTPFPANSNYPGGDPLQQADWAMPAASYGDPSLEQGYGRGQQGYDQQHGGALEPTYGGQDEAGGYEVDEPRRVSWTMRIAGAVVVAIGLGYGLAQAYKSVLGGPAPDGATPVVSSEATPAKEKPLDPGGKQFSHTDSKVLGRLGDGGSATEEQPGGLSESDASNGSKKVTTLVVGRDGSIAPPEAGAAEPAPPPAEPESSVSVPGLTVVDAFGSAAAHAPPQRSAPAAPPQQQAEAPPVVVNAPPKARVNVKSTKVIPPSTASIPDDEPAAPVAPKKQKVAAAAPAASNEGATSATTATAATGANGYVVVLASVPASGSSRLDALRKFADMQQQYGPVLANKTPDVRETTLAGKGAYHRLLVGPPGSRSQASELCTQLKASGYKDCWVTAY
jgi:SPOR domain